jgi:histidyl-tRNA synthetase
VFEWVTDRLGAQGAVCSGGRYDGLVEQLGGKPVPAIGWAIGLERLLELYRVCGGEVVDTGPDIYVVAVGDSVLRPAFQLVEQIRADCPNLKLEMNCGGDSFKSQMKRADRSGAAVALILGDDEVAQRVAGIKPLRNDTAQISAGWDGLNEALEQFFL